MKFEWDSAKEKSNQRRHRLSFAEAQQLFESGSEYLEIYDSEHSDVEDRFIAVGSIERGVAVVVYTEKEEGVIRIIGARLASKRERDLYREQVSSTDE